MEVDDAIEMAQPVEEKTVLDDAVDGSEQTAPSSSTSAKQKRAKIKHDKEEPPGGIETQINDSVLTATPFKLEVSGSEDEKEEDGDSSHKANLRRKLLLTPLEEDTAAKDGLEDLEEISIKRKRYEVRRSGSEECLLGFDELSGEAELVKAEVFEKQTVLAEENLKLVEEEADEEPFKNVSKECEEGPLNSPRSSKKVTQTSKVVSPGLQSTVSSAKSPRTLKPKTPPLETSQVPKVATHIVADGEETNGIATSPTKSSSVGSTKKLLSPKDDFYKKPFEYGWRRELVWRANPEISKDKADVYFISPAGKKLRGRNEILPLLEGDLTIEHFCFTREPLGANPEVETVRSAKPSSRATVTAATLAAASTPPNIGKRVSKPKGPKGASPPPQGWTPSKALKVNNAALLSSTGSISRSSASYHPIPSTPPSSRKQDNAHAHATHSAKNSKTKKNVNDIENDLKQINESIRKNRKQSNNSVDGSLQNPNSHNSIVVDHSNKLFATNFFANVSYAYDSLLCILKYLKIHERPRAAAVCKLWNLAAKDTSLWQTVRMKNSKVCSWFGFAGALRRGETKHLDLRKMLLPSGRSEDMWNDFCSNIGTVYSLETIDLCRCSARVVESLFQSNCNLKVINALAINDDTINLENIALLQYLEELRLRTCETGFLSGDLNPISSLSKLTHLSLTSIKGLGAKSVEVLGELTTLKSLELGECGDFDSSFAEAVLPKLINLQRLRLENSQVTNVCTLEILDAVARLVQLNQLELVNFDIKPGFDEKLSFCMNISKLLIIPTYISQSATTNQIVLSAVQQVSETLKVFTWCVTVELLRVTALYVDQCEESTKKEKHHFDECIPVLKPVPGANTGEEDEAEERNKPKSPAITEDGSAAAEVPQIEILPLDKVESILAENLPHTKFTIVKVPYHATCKQQLVELN